MISEKKKAEREAAKQRKKEEMEKEKAAKMAERQKLKDERMKQKMEEKVKIKPSLKLDVPNHPCSSVMHLCDWDSFHGVSLLMVFKKSRSMITLIRHTFA